MNDLAQQIKALAEKATAGEWSVCTDATGDTFIAAMTDSAETICEFGAMDNDEGQASLDADAALIVLLRNNVDQILTALSEAERMREAGQAVIAQAFDHYTARNGRRIGIEGDDGEKCWIVPFDAFESLRAAIGGE